MKTFSDRRSVEQSLSDPDSVLLGRGSAVGFFSNLSDAEYAATGLRSVGFPLDQITLVANYFRRQDQFVDVNLCNCFEVDSLTISAEQARLYQERLDHGEYMVIVDGSEDELNCATSIFSHRNIEDWQIYNSRNC